MANSAAPVVILRWQLRFWSGTARTRLEHSLGQAITSRKPQVVFQEFTCVCKILELPKAVAPPLTADLATANSTGRCSCQCCAALALVSFGLESLDCYIELHSLELALCWHCCLHAQVITQRDEVWVRPPGVLRNARPQLVPASHQSSRWTFAATEVLIDASSTVRP